MLILACSKNLFFAGTVITVIFTGFNYHMANPHNLIATEASKLINYILFILWFEKLIHKYFIKSVYTHKSVYSSTANTFLCPLSWMELNFIKYKLHEQIMTHINGKNAFLHTY